MAFTDDELKHLKEECYDRVWPPNEVGTIVFQVSRLKAFFARLEAAETALAHADGAIYSVYDPYKNDCPLCDNFLGPCKDYCDFPKFHKSLEEWRKAAGK